MSVTHQSSDYNRSVDFMVQFSSTSVPSVAETGNECCACFSVAILEILVVDSQQTSQKTNNFWQIYRMPVFFLFLCNPPSLIYWHMHSRCEHLSSKMHFYNIPLLCKPLLSPLCCPTENAGVPLPETSFNKSSRLILAALGFRFPLSKLCLLSVSLSLILLLLPLLKNKMRRNVLLSAVWLCFGSEWGKLKWASRVDFYCQIENESRWITAAPFGSLGNS